LLSLGEEKVGREEGGESGRGRREKEVGGGPAELFGEGRLVEFTFLAAVAVAVATTAAVPAGGCDGCGKNRWRR